MKHRVCGRTWEAEAIADGRLDGPARASFERHAGICQACGEELRALARIADRVRELPDYASRAIDKRRVRIAVIQRANLHLMRGKRPGLSVWAFAAIAACTLVLAMVGARYGALKHVPPPPIRDPAFEIVDVGHASWTTTAAAGVAHVRLSVGTAAIHVEHLASGQRFLVDLPDGDLEVRGTRFQVSIADDRTMRVEVSEGVVALRLFREPEVVLMAGQQWSAPATVEPGPAAASAAPPSRPPNAQALALPRSPSTAPAPLPLVPRVLEVEPPPPPARVDAAARGESVPTPDPFVASIRAFESGDYGAADRLFARFIRENPSDARSEDAAFLRAVSRARMGDAAGATRLASDYLQRYPQGLRRPEAERLVATGQPSRP
jgi:FecR-like protein